MNDFLTALYAAAVSVTSGEANEAEVTLECSEGERVQTLTATIRRFGPEHMAALNGDDE